MRAAGPSQIRFSQGPFWAQAQSRVTSAFGPQGRDLLLSICEDTLNTLDPREALVLDTHELGRRAGAMLKKSFTAPAPADLGSEVIGILEGSDLELNLRLESVVEGVLVSGEVTANTTGMCSRCLADISQDLTVDFQELFEYADDDNSSSEDDDLLQLEGDLLNLEPVVRDALVLALPLAPLCDDDCLGLCPECGIDRNKEPNHEHEIVDSRWQALQGLLTENDPQEG